MLSAAGYIVSGLLLAVATGLAIALRYEHTQRVRLATAHTNLWRDYDAAMDDNARLHAAIANRDGLAAGRRDGLLMNRVLQQPMMQHQAQWPGARPVHYITIDD